MWSYAIHVKVIYSMIYFIKEFSLTLWVPQTRYLIQKRDVAYCHGQDYFINNRGLKLITSELPDCIKIIHFQ